MGAFDDLLPGKSSGGAFDDLLPKAEAKPRFNDVEVPNWIENQLAKITLPESVNWGLNRARGFAMGAADPTVGAVQLGANALGAVFDKPTLSGLVTGDNGGISSSVNRAIAKKEAEYEADRQGVGSEGIDWARAGGNLASPVNVIAASRIPMAATTGMRAAQGAAMGGVAGLTQPVSDASNYWTTKAQQGAVGAVAGGVLTPALGKVGDSLVRRMQPADPAIAGARASLETDQIISKALAEVGQTINDLPQATIQNLRQQVIGSLKQGKKLDAAAVLRKQDFDSVGMPSLLGQITRDPMQFSRELNLRGVENLGEPIAARLGQQNRILQSNINGFSNGASDDAYLAGKQVADALSSADEGLRRSVSGLYTQARNSAGKDLDVPLQGLAQDYATVLNQFGDNVPSGVRNQFNALGLDPLNPSNQKQLFTIEQADKLLKIINENDPGAFSNRPMSTALGKLRDAVKNSVLSVDASGGPFAPAVKAAADRFKLQDAVPALKAAAEGSVAPDDFIKRFVLNGKTEQVSGLANLLQKTDPDAFAQARAQIGAHLNRAAFGENATGDKSFAAERFNKALREIGASKMRAFFSGDEVTRLNQLARVGAYIHQAPPASAVNSSNTASALMNVAGRIPGMPAAMSIAKSVKGAVDNAATVRSAVNSVPPTTRADLTPEQRMRLADLLSVGAIGAGFAGGAAFR